MKAWRKSEIVKIVSISRRQSKKVTTSAATSNKHNSKHGKQKWQHQTKRQRGGGEETIST